MWIVSPLDKAVAMALAIVMAMLAAAAISAAAPGLPALKAAAGSSDAARTLLCSQLGSERGCASGKVLMAK